MFVRARMTANPFTVTPTTTVPEAQALLKAHNIRNLPVVKDGRLVGLVGRRDLLLTDEADQVSVLDHRQIADGVRLQQRHGVGDGGGGGDGERVGRHSGSDEHFSLLDTRA